MSHDHDHDETGWERARRGPVAPLVVTGMTLTCLAQLRHLEVAADGGLVWNLPLGLAVGALAVMNLAVWLLYRDTRRLEGQIAALERRP